MPYIHAITGHDNASLLLPEQAFFACAQYVNAFPSAFFYTPAQQLDYIEYTTPLGIATKQFYWNAQALLERVEIIGRFPNNLSGVWSKEFNWSAEDQLVSVSYTYGAEVPN